jgi:hypothetical protein
VSALTHDHFCSQSARIGRRKKEDAFHQAQEATWFLLWSKTL